MRHHAQNVAAGVADAGDVARRAVRVRLARDEPLGITVSKDDPPVALELIKRRFIGEVVSLAMCDRHAQHSAPFQLTRERCVNLLNTKKDIAANEAKMLVPHQRARQQTRLGDHLKTIADAEYQSARCRMTSDRL